MNVPEYRLWPTLRDVHCQAVPTVSTPVAGSPHLERNRNRDAAVLNSAR